MSDQFKVSDLHLYRTVVKGGATNASSRYRAVRNALNRYETGQYKLEDFRFQHRASTADDWAHDKKAEQDFLKNAALVNPRDPNARTAKVKETKEVDPTEAARKAIRHLSAVCKAVAGHTVFTPRDLEILQGAMSEVVPFLPNEEL